MGKEDREVEGKTGDKEESKELIVYLCGEVKRRQ